MGIALTEMDSAGLLVEMLYEQGRPVTEVLVAAPGSTGCSVQPPAGSVRLVARVAGPSQLPARDLAASMQLTAWAAGSLQHPACGVGPTDSIQPPAGSFPAACLGLSLRASGSRCVSRTLAVACRRCSVSRSPRVIELAVLDAAVAAALELILIVLKMPVSLGSSLLSCAPAGGIQS